MATKKAQSKAPAASSSSSATGNDVWKWVYIVGILVASLMAAFNVPDPTGYLPVVFALVGLLVGLFYFNSDDVMNFGLRFLIVTAAAGSLGVLPAVGEYLTRFFTAFAAFLGPIVLGMAIMHFWKKYFGNMM